MPDSRTGSSLEHLTHLQTATRTPVSLNAQARPREDLVGTVIGDRYNVLERLTSGGMGVVYRAEDKFGRSIAIKILKPQFAADQEAVGRFTREAKSIAAVDSPHIVNMVDFGKMDEGGFYIAMQFVDGSSLLDAKTGLTLLDKVAIIKEAADALHAAHELRDDKGQLLNLVHRDISPSNILLSRAGEVKLADFGIAKATQLAEITRGNIRKGKYAYMSPEQARGEPVDCRSDVFAAGIVLFELVDRKSVV